MSGPRRDPRMQARFDAWAVWLFSGSGGGGSMHPLARLMEGEEGGSDGFRAFVPVDSVECSVTDEAVRALPADLREAVRAWHCCKEGTLDMVARDLGIVRGTLHRRLCQADQRIAAWLRERVRRECAAVTY